MPSPIHIVVSSPPRAATFIQQDARLLSQGFEARLIPVEGFRSLVDLKSAIQEADVLLTWFLGRYALPAIYLARHYHVPIVSIIGGFEVAWVEDLAYGIRPGSFKERILRWMIAQSDRILSVSEFSMHEALERFPESANKFELVRNAVDTEKFRPSGQEPRCGVISVGAIDRGTIGRKSWNLFRETAVRMPETPFMMVGAASDRAGREFVRHLPDNVTWLGLITLDELLYRLTNSSVYLQLSIHEAFCVALVEAMACGCFPVVSNHAALPEVVGDAGEILPDLRMESIESAVRAALCRPEHERQSVRQFTIDRYGIETRRQLLTSIIRRTVQVRVA